MLGRLLPGRFRRNLAHKTENSDLSKISLRVRDDRLTYLTEAKFANLEACIRDVERNGVPGDVYEAGVAFGGSAIVLAKLMGPDRCFHGYDVFEQIPPPSELDEDDAHRRYTTIARGRSEGIEGDLYYGYVPDLYREVCRAFERYGLTVEGQRVSLHRGMFEDTLQPDGPVALAHIDCDWHDPVKLCLERLYPHLAKGGYLVLDDYNDYSGCQRATDGFLAQHGDLEVVTDGPNLVARLSFS